MNNLSSAKIEAQTPSALYAEINAWHAIPFMWGRYDCALLVSDWVKRVVGRDPAVDLRDTYRDINGAARIGWFRDPVGVMGSRMEAIGLRRIQAPSIGDIGIIERRDDARGDPYAAIYLGDCWAVKGEHGAVTWAPSLVEMRAAWSVGYEEPECG